MTRPFRCMLPIVIALMFGVVPNGQNGSATAPAVHGTFAIHMILHDVGTETYDIVTNADGTRTLTTTLEYTDRASKRTTTATLTTTGDERPIALEIKAPAVSAMTVKGPNTTIEIRGASRTSATPPGAAVIGAAPFALQMMMMRAWQARGEPKQLPLVSLNPDAEPLEIVRVGRDTITIDKRRVTLNRYTVANLMFGREILWTTANGDLAAAMTFAGGLPMEAVRTEFKSALPDLYRAGVAQELANLDAIGAVVRPVARGRSYAITGATLITATGTAPIPESVVIVRDGRIAFAGPRAATVIPSNLEVIDAKGLTVLPGLWEMHTHASGVEFGPAHLAAGITTARDLGGEMDFLVAVRDAIAKKNAIGPRMLLAGLVDAGGIRAFGHVTAETPDEGRAVVQRYHAAGFEQIKLYTYLTADTVKAIADEAHRLGMKVSGHVPQALTAKAGIEAGMDELNHLNYATSLLRTPAADGRGQGAAPLDLRSEAAQAGIKFLLDHKTVVDPTSSWGEMGSHSREIDLASIEPGILLAPAVLDSKFRGMAGNSTAEQMKSRMAQTLSVIGVLHKAGVPIVPGSDTGLVGHGLHREIELYVQAGMTPMEAIQSATIVSARAMGLDKDSGTVEAGKRADLILVDGNPLTDIRLLRRVTRVVANGRMYDTAALWKSVGFK